MTRHLTPADYIKMPWANGRGTTTEILRKTAPDGGILWRFSMATVSENGAFSCFPDIERNLTVIDGPGFDLVGNTQYHAALLQPVAFPGDIALAAQNVIGTAVDFNVMTHRSLPRPKVELAENVAISALPGAALCLLALGRSRYGETTLARHDFVWNAPNAALQGAAALVIHLFEVAT